MARPSKTTQSASLPERYDSSAKKRAADSDLTPASKRFKTTSAQPATQTTKKAKTLQNGKMNAITAVPAINYKAKKTRKTVQSTEKKLKSPERRLKRFRDHPPLSFIEKLHRATTQRMFVIDRQLVGTPNCPGEEFELAGSTGNIYTVSIAQLPTCTCPDHLKGNQCKHVIYILHQVLKAPAQLVYQRAFLSSELQQIFNLAPHPVENAVSSEDRTKNASKTHDSSNPALAVPSTPSKSAKQKPIDGDCPICFMPFDEDDKSNSASSDASAKVDFCRAACGNNVHIACFEQWAKSQAGQEVRCVYCRAPWRGDENQIKRICREKARLGQAKDRNGEGYINVAAELGISGARDYSTYHQHWVRRVGLGHY